MEEDEKEDNVGYELSLKHGAEGLDEADLGEADLDEVQGQVHDLHAPSFWMSQLEIVVHSSADPRTVCLDRQLEVLLVKNQRQRSMRRVQNYQSCDAVGFAV